MRFAFLIHPVSEQTRDLMALDRDGRLRKTWGRADLLQFCAEAHAAFEGRSRPVARRTIEATARGRHVRRAGLGDRRPGGRTAVRDPDGRAGILEDPGQAIEYMEQAVEHAAEWGARVVGLGSMTGIVGEQGEHLAERGPLPVTTGNSLTVYAALQSL